MQKWMQIFGQAGGATYDPCVHSTSGQVKLKLVHCLLSHTYMLASIHTYIYTYVCKHRNTKKDPDIKFAHITIRQRVALLFEQFLLLFLTVSPIKEREEYIQVEKREGDADRQRETEREREPVLYLSAF